MRRRLYFDYSSAENSYIIQEDGNSIFRINGNTLKFVSLEFYNGVYAGNKSTAIDFENKIADNVYPMSSTDYLSPIDACCFRFERQDVF